MIVETLKNSVLNSCEEAVDTSATRCLWDILDLCLLHSLLLEFFFDKHRISEVFEVFHFILSQENVTSSNIVSVVELIEKYIHNKEITFCQVCGIYLNALQPPPKKKS